MDIKIRTLLEKLDEQLKNNDTESDGFLNIESRAISISTAILGELKNLIIGHTFKNDEEEIFFFKYQKPKFLSRLIFHHSIYRIELQKPLGGEVLLRSYLNKELIKLKLYFDENLDFYKYIRSESEYLDNTYFLRGKPMMKLCQDLASFENDAQFCTSHGFLLAKTIAHCQIEDYINLSLANLERKVIGSNSELQQTPTWTGSKTSLIELIYALHCHGVIENSKLGLKNLISFFESVFNIKLGNPHVTIYEIKERKNGFCRFLDALKQTMVSTIKNENDE